MQCRQLSRRIAHTDPEYLRSKCSGFANGDFEWRNVRRRSINSCRNSFDSIHLDVSKKLQRQMNVLDATPTRRHIRNRPAQSRNMVLQLRTDVRRKFHRTKHPPRYRSRLHGTYCRGGPPWPPGVELDLGNTVDSVI